MRRMIHATQNGKAGGQTEMGPRNFKNPTYTVEPSAPPSVNTLNNINNARYVSFCVLLLYYNNECPIKVLSDVSEIDTI